MRVLLFSQAPGVGGGERAVIPTLARIGAADVTVVAPAAVCAFASEHGLRTIEAELPRAHRLRQPLRVLRGVRRLRRAVRDLRPDVIYANGTRALPYALGVRASGGPPVLAHHHGLLTSGPTTAFARSIDRWADVVVVPSEASGAPFRRRDKLRVIPNGVDLERFRPSGDRRNAMPVVATLTRPDPRKGMGTFLDLAEAVGPVARFVLAGGPAFPHEEQPYETALERARHIAHVETPGSVADPAALYRAADVYAHLGEPEGFGLTLVEAMASGLPVVAYGWGAVPEIVTDGVDGFVPAPSDLGGAAMVVRRLIDDPELRARVGAEARRTCEARYGRDRYTAAIAAALLELAA